MKLQIELNEDELKDLIFTQAVNANLRTALEAYTHPVKKGYLDCSPAAMAKNFTDRPGEVVFQVILKAVVVASQREVTKQFREHMAKFEPNIKIDYHDLMKDIRSSYGLFPPKAKDDKSN